MRSPLRRNLLIAGSPGTGKTTLVRKISAALAPLDPAGFYTEEVREGGRRTGFRLVSLTGEEALLSHTSFRSDFKVGSYGVDVEAFERFLAELPLERHRGPLIIDEIGKMECLSARFRRLILKLLDSTRVVVATVPTRSEGFIASIKERDDVILFLLTRTNRDSTLDQLLAEIAFAGEQREGATSTG